MALFLNNNMATLISTITLVLTSFFMVGGGSLQTGGILDACNQYSLSGVSHDKCEAFFASALGKQPSEPAITLIAFTLAFARVKAALFFAMGLGGVYALVKLAPGTPSVAVVHLMQGIFFCCACCIHMHNSKMLGFGVDPNMRAEEGTFIEITKITGLLGTLSWVSFTLCSSSSASGSSASSDGERRAMCCCARKAKKE